MCSVEKAKELGLDWWNPKRIEALAEGQLLTAPEHSFEARIAKLEAELAANRSLPALKETHDER